MTVTVEQLRPALRAWTDGRRDTVAALRRAFAVIYRERPTARTLDDILEGLLLSVVRRHETRTAAALDRLGGALDNLLSDVEALRTVDAAARPPALREADLHALADALNDLHTFEDGVGPLIDRDPGEVREAMRALLTAPTEPVHAATTLGHALPPLARIRSRALEVIAWSDEILRAWREGHTLEPVGVPTVEVPWPDHPRLVEEMERMRRAMDDWRSASSTDATMAQQAADELQRAVARGNELLRSFGRRFDAVTAGDRIPPARPLPAGLNPPAGSVAADALAVRERLTRSGLASAPAAELFDALTFSELEVTVSGRLGEPISRQLPGTGLETYALTPNDIRSLKTSPPWLAGRLAAIVDGWERAHLVGPGFGGELFAGLMSAPQGVNQVAQNRGIERFLRAASATGAAASVGGTARGRRLAIPLANGAFEYVDVLGSVRYEIPTASAPLRFEVVAAPDGSWQVTRSDLPVGAPGADVPRSGTR